MNFKVFISYSWDDDSHKDWVLNLGNELIKNGVDVFLDQYDLSLGMEMTHFMEKAMTADKILAILTPNYKLKADNRKGGVGYEYSLITKEYYNSEPDKTKIFPILRNGDEATSTPTFMQTRVFHDMRDDETFDAKLFQLIKLITGQSIVKKPELGKLPDFEDKIPDIEKSLSDYKQGEEYHTKKKAIINGAKGVQIFLAEVEKIVNQISESLENYKKNFQFHFYTKRVRNESILFSSFNFTFYVGMNNLHANTAEDAVIEMNFYKGLVGFDELAILKEQPELIYLSKYKFDLDKAYNPIFVKSDNPNITLNSHDVATVALREVIANEIKFRELKRI
jgi:6-pyruvoyl-tetrahydropterin synthase